MKKLLTICAVLLMAGPALAAWNSVHVSDANTVLLMHLDEPTGTITPIADAGIFGKTGTLANPGAALQLEENLTWVPSMAGFGNAAYSYYNSASDSNVGTLTIDDSAGELGTSTPYGDWTFEFWMNTPNAGAGWGSRILKKGSGGTFAINYQNGSVSLGWYMGGWRTALFTTIMPQNVWTHTAITVENIDTGDNATRYAIFNLWLNGNMVESITGLPGQKFANWDTANVALFNDLSPLYTARQYYGMLDEVRISNVNRYPIPEPSMMLLALGALAIFRKK